MQDSVSSKPAPPGRQLSAPARRKTRRLKSYRLRCDCGQPAVMVKKVRVGTNPQYVVKLPLCASCLALERSFNVRG